MACIIFFYFKQQSRSIQVHTIQTVIFSFITYHRPYRPLLWLFPLLLISLLSGCETPPGTENPTRPAPHITQFEVQPDTVSFRDTQTAHDTLITVAIEAVVEEASNSTISYAIREESSDSVASRGILSASGERDNRYQGTAQFRVTTATFTTFHVYIYPDGKRAHGSWVREDVHILGFPGSPPRILAVSHPDTVQKPQGDSVRNVPFQARVTDPDGQQNIAFVGFHLLPRSTQDTTTIELHDNGSDNSGDPIAGDSVYTQVLSVSADNQNATYDIHFFARDKSNLVSDTVKTTFTITD